MSEKRDLWVILDVLWPLVPPSLLGAFMGDALRKDVLTGRQRAAVFLAMAMLGCVGGVGIGREYDLSEYSAAAIAIVISTIGTDLIGLAVAILRQIKEDPIGAITKVRDAILSFLPRKP